MSDDRNQKLSLEEFFETIASRASFILPEGVTPYDTLENDLSLDSLQVFELLVITEILSGVEVPPETTPSLISGVDLYEYYLECGQTALPFGEPL